jgi:hypothetical protein
LAEENHYSAETACTQSKLEQFDMYNNDDNKDLIAFQQCGRSPFGNGQAGKTIKFVSVCTESVLVFQSRNVHVDPPV